MDFYQFNIMPFFDIDEAWKQLKTSGASPLYSEEDENVKIIYGYLPSNLLSEILLKNQHFLNSIASLPFPETNWQQQWEMHGLNFEDGCINIELEEYGYIGEAKTVKLYPGAGFGDMSHPTTEIVLRFLCKYAPNQNILDVGSGSGVLSICAAAIGANSIVGIDIDPEAVLHARHNAEVNNLHENAIFTTAEEFLKIKNYQPMIAAMNMIYTEQIQAWNSLKPIHMYCTDFFTSGVRVEEREIYLNIVAEWGWKLVKEVQQNDWLGFHFKV